VEKTLIDQLNLHYLHAHQIATRAEQAAVRAAGIRWRDYDRLMQKYVKRIGDERLTKVPADLDLKPYRDEHDDDLVQRMLASITRGQAPLGVTANHVESAVGRYMPHLTHSKARRRKSNRGAAQGLFRKLARIFASPRKRKIARSHEVGGELDGKIGRLRTLTLACASIFPRVPRLAGLR